MFKKKSYLKNYKKAKNFVEMEILINLIVDIAEQCYNFQKKKKTEFINLPVYKLDTTVYFCENMFKKIERKLA